MGINYPANRPDPDGPGGLGAEESGTERTGSTQDYLLAIQQGARWAEVGRYYDSANDPVTGVLLGGNPPRPNFAVRATPLLRHRANGAIMSFK